MNKNNNGTSIFALGGLGEIGKNMYCFMHEDEVVIVDAGIVFPQGELMGIDYVIPDVSYFKDNNIKIRALIITHGHLDHIGGIPFMLETLDIKEIYAPNQAIGLILKGFKEKNIRYKSLYTYDGEKPLKFKHFEIDFLRTTHSIPDSHGIVIKTSNGVIVTTGDFKFDFSPVGPMADLYKMSKVGKEGVDLLLSDSTNSLSEGMSTSESKVDNALGELFKNAEGRIIVATFASNIYRLKHIVDTCKRNNRKVVTFGRSMDTNIEISIQGGYIKHKEIFVTPEEANKLPNNQICLLCTGSQGEPLAALSRIANDTHRQIKIKGDDLVIFSSSPIPGNALSISRTINKLYMKGIKVYTNTLLSDIHSSGHAKQDELKLMLRLINPKYFMPIHGEYRMLKTHADLGIECGIPKERTFVLGNGESLILKNHEVTRGPIIPSGEVYIDGNRIGEVTNKIMKERKTMSNEGFLVISGVLNSKLKQVYDNLNITTRGFVLVNYNLDLINELEGLVKSIVDKSIKDSIDLDLIKDNIVNELLPIINEKTGRKPLIIINLFDDKNKKFI